jgi:FMN phosphatase YigB (HAD superfamily)
VPERPDEYYVDRLIERIRLLIATSDDIPVDTKLQTQPMLKEFQASLAVPPHEQDQERARSQYAFLYRELEEYADLEALLHALKNFVPYLK